MVVLATWRYAPIPNLIDIPFHKHLSNKEVRYTEVKAGDLKLVGLGPSAGMVHVVSLAE